MAELIGPLAKDEPCELETVEAFRVWYQGDAADLRRRRGGGSSEGGQGRREEEEVERETRDCVFVAACVLVVGRCRGFVFYAFARERKNVDSTPAPLASISHSASTLPSRTPTK